MPPVGIVGLGTMGGSIALHLLDAGYPMIGRDVKADSIEAFRALGGQPVSTPADVITRAEVVVLSLPTVAAFKEVVEAPDGLVAGARAGAVVVETSTLPIEVKQWAHDQLAEHGVTLLDCPISGTGAQMRTKDIAIYASGDPDGLAKARHVLASFSRSQFEVGVFGNGSKLKFIANLLVAIHNVSSAEALLVAQRAGLDLDTTLAALTAGAGTSRMLEVRGPMMISGQYEDATMQVKTFQKDVDIITAFARGVDCPVPLFATAAQINVAALAQGHAEEDTASVFAVLQRLAGSS